MDAELGDPGWRRGAWRVGRGSAQREALEELGVEIEVDRLSGVYWGAGWRGIGGHHFVFRARLREGAIPRAADAGEILETRWRSVEELPRPISDFTVRRLRDALAGGPAQFEVVGPRNWLE